MKKEMTFKKIEDKAKYFCNKNHIEYDDYIKNFVNILLKKYYEDREVYLFEKASYKLNNHFRTEYESAYNNFHISRIDLFEWLDKVDDQIFFILTPVCLYAPRKISDKKFKHQKIEWTGIQNIDIVEDYLKYKYSIENDKWNL